MAGSQEEKILLIMLPFWDPLIPPQGIARIKHFLCRFGYMVRTVDANTDHRFRKLYYRYFEVLAEFVPHHNQGNFYNIGHDVLRNHMLAHIHHEDKREYIELAKKIIYNTFFTPFSDPQVAALNNVLDDFFRTLEEYMTGLLSKEKPSVFGLSVVRDTIAASLFAFRLTKEQYPHVRTVMGGSIFSDHLLEGTPNLEFFLKKTPYIDKILIGKGELLFLKWLKNELPESKKVCTPRDIDGEPADHSTMKLPDLSDFNSRQVYPYLAAQGSSSCPFQCSFCNVAAFFGRYREKDPAQTVEEMMMLYRQYGQQLFFMLDAQVNGVATGIAGELLKRDISLYWDAYLRVDNSVPDVEHTLLWRRGGFYRARLGVESGSQHVLDLMHKGITPQKSRACLAGLAQVGIKTTTYWVIGHPGETEDDFRQTLALLEDARNDIYEAECNPFIFGYSGQGHSGQWEDKRKPLYPESVRDMLIIGTWFVDEEPTRQETYRRINRFVQHCNRLGIPNPYTLQEIYNADERWKKLHKNAVPPLIDFKENGRRINECKNLQPISMLKKTIEEDGDFDF